MTALSAFSRTTIRAVDERLEKRRGFIVPKKELNGFDRKGRKGRCLWACDV
jgi:hypothetical protein